MDFETFDEAHENRRKMLWNEAQQELTTLRARVAELERDGKRMEFLERFDFEVTANWDFSLHRFEWRAKHVLAEEWKETEWHNSLREAIHAAMSTEEGEGS